MATHVYAWIDTLIRMNPILPHVYTFIYTVVCGVRVSLFLLCLCLCIGLFIGTCIHMDTWMNISNINQSCAKIWSTRISVLMHAYHWFVYIIDSCFSFVYINTLIRVDPILAHDWLMLHTLLHKKSSSSFATGYANVSFDGIGNFVGYRCTSKYILSCCVYIHLQTQLCVCLSLFIECISLYRSLHRSLSWVFISRFLSLVIRFEDKHSFASRTLGLQRSVGSLYT